MKQQSLQVLQEAQVSRPGDSVAGEVQVLQVDVLVEVVHGLDVVVGQAEPGEQVDVLQPLDGDQVVRREVKNLAL